MADMARLHTLVQENFHVSRQQVESVLSLIYSQPREHWAELASALGLDGEPVHLNAQARSRGQAELAPVR